LYKIPANSDASLSEILAYCMLRTNEQGYSHNSIRNFRLAVRKRLQNMADEEKITRTQLGTKLVEGRFKAKNETH
ncbi:hypothetical protein L1D46_07800, partial [Pseudoalteromonas sp. Isolate3]|uniref:hypothetical protein n=1 Tax=Pseudoalteromonas sp. Isolate3 TaxID=2908526 RepID=UPI001EFD5033